MSGEEGEWKEHSAGGDQKANKKNKLGGTGKQVERKRERCIGKGTGEGGMGVVA